MMDANTLTWIAIGIFAAFFIYSRFAGKVSPARARELVSAGARLVDVRSTGEFASGHIDGALNIPVDQLAARIGEIGPKDKPVVVYCASGMRSARAAGLLKSVGFATVEDLGPMSRW
jgi:rhodanese-related sulfurtransferase